MHILFVAQHWAQISEDIHMEVCQVKHKGQFYLWRQLTFDDNGRRAQGRAGIICCLTRI